MSEEAKGRTDVEKVAILRRALEWYANPGSWKPDDWGVQGVVKYPDYGDAGGKARRALKRAGVSR